MASGHFAVVYREIGRLFGAGTVVGLTEGQLLDRFVARRDDEAFEAIVARHGAMVLSVCRDHLRDPNDVDDAFQATFLVLVRRAGSLRHRDGLGNWLHGVARRVAKRARIHAARRRDREGLGPEPADPSSPDASDFELRPMIHDEVGRLPESYRAAVVLCFFEGRTHEEAADRLGWPVGTVKGRLARAKELLRDRLSRRGVTIPAGLLLGTLTRSSEAAVPPGLLVATVSASSSLARSIPLSALGTTSGALALTEGVLRTMIVTKLKVATTLFVALGVLSGSGVLAYQAAGGPGRGGTGPATTPPAATASKNDTPDPVVLAQSRVKIAEEALAYHKKSHDQGAISSSDPKMLEWARRLYEARVDAGVPREEAVKPYLDALTSAEEAARKLAESGQGSNVDALELAYQRLQVVAAAAKAPIPPASATNPGMGMGMGMGMGAGSPGRAGTMAAVGSQTGPAPGSPPPVGQPAGGGGMMAAGGGQIPLGGGGGFGGDVPSAPRRPRKEDPADLERNKQIQTQMNRPLHMSFPQETPLEDVLKYIRTNTTSEELKFSNGLPIYVDPQGLQEVEKTMTSPVLLDIDGVPLRTTLRLILHQIDLDYRVRDGLVFISSRNSLEEEDQEAEQEAMRQEIMALRKQRGLLPSMGGMSGMGGVGGIGGGAMGVQGGMKLPGAPSNPNSQPTPNGNRSGGLQ